MVTSHLTPFVVGLQDGASSSSSFKEATTSESTPTDALAKVKAMTPAERAAMLAALSESVCE